MPPDFGPTARGVVLAEEPELQVKTTETGHIVCHLYYLIQAPDVSRPSIPSQTTGETRRVKAHPCPAMTESLASGAKTSHRPFAINR